MNAMICAQIETLTKGEVYAGQVRARLEAAKDWLFAIPLP